MRTGSPYAVAPARITKNDGTPYRVFTPFFRAWQQHGWRKPADTAADMLTWLEPGDKHGGPRRVKVPDDERVEADLQPAGEQAALARWHEFRDDDVSAYERERDRPDKPGTSRMSVHLKYGTVHPRTLPQDVGVEVAPGQLAAETLDALGRRSRRRNRGQVGEQRPRMDLAEAQRRREL